MNSFNLYKEAKDYYDRLIPNRIDGLILVALFEKHGDESFSEKEFLQAIEATLKDLGLNSSRTEYERNNNIILRLQDHFIWRDGGRKQYSFKTYGLEFCTQLKKRLLAGYNPAKIKRWFDDLYNRLVELNQREKGFRIWIEDHFDLRHLTLGEQIEVLDEQVNNSVKQFRKEIKSKKQQSGIIEILQGIQAGLDVIKLQADELRRAFQATYDIDDFLTGILEESESEEYLKDIRRVRSFNESVRSHLEQVSNRIDKIKPRIREFIYDFNQGNFDRKTEAFLNSILKYSTVNRQNQGRKVLHLPFGIPSIPIQDKLLMPKFIIVPIKEISPKKPIDITPRSIDRERQSILLVKSRAWKKEKDDVEWWLGRAFKQIDSSGRLDFTEFFYEILKSENSSLSLAVKVAHQVLRRSSRINELEVNGQKKVTLNEIITNVAVWKMQVNKR